MAELLTAKDLEGATPLLSAAELEGAEPARRKPKYPGPKSVSDEEVGLGTGMIKTHRVPGTTLNFVEKPEALGAGEKAYQAARNAEDADKTVADLAVSGGAAGGLKAALASKLAKPIASAATGLNSLSAAVKGGKPIAERIADALGHTVEHSVLARGIQLFAPGAVEVGKKAVGAGVAAAPTVAGTAAGELGPRVSAPPAVLPGDDEPKPFKGVMSNAVDRLRASAGNNPRAADLLARMEASKNTPTGTVTQGTGAH